MSFNPISHPVQKFFYRKPSQKSGIFLEVWNQEFWINWNQERQLLLAHLSHTEAENNVTKTGPVCKRIPFADDWGGFRKTERGRVSKEHGRCAQCNTEYWPCAFGPWFSAQLCFSVSRGW